MMEEISGITFNPNKGATIWATQVGSKIIKSCSPGGLFREKIICPALFNAVEIEKISSIAIIPAQFPR